MVLIGKRRNSYFVYIDGDKTRYKQVYDFGASDDFKTVVFSVEKGGEHGIVRNGKFETTDGVPKDVVLTGSGRRLALGVELDEKKYRYVVDGRPEPTADGVFGGTFDSSERHFTYAAIKDGKWTVITDGRKSRDFEKILSPPVFSPNGKHVAFVGERNGLCRIAVNDQEIGEFDGIVAKSAPVFVEDSMLRVLMYRSKNGKLEFYRVTVNIN